jgi:hypothetical protein
MRLGYEAVTQISSELNEGWSVDAGECYRSESGPAIRVTITTLQPDESVRLADAMTRIAGPSRRAGGA